MPQDEYVATSYDVFISYALTVTGKDRKWRPVSTTYGGNRSGGHSDICT
jgi:hypothetical protein